MRFHREVIKVEEARKRIQQHIQIGKTERISLEQSMGRYLAEDIYSNQPLPHFRRSGMDGYAIRSIDTTGATRESPVCFEVIETIPCGSVPRQTIQLGQASKIMTGAVVPDGADAVVMIEMTTSFEAEGKNWITVPREIKQGTNITPIGEEAAVGDLLLTKGRRIGAGEMAILATFGHASVKVYRQPHVAIFATGSELLPIDSPPVLGKIRNSNSYMLAGLVTQAGGIPFILSNIPDDVERVQTEILSAMDEYDLVITTGGVSVGDYDILVDLFAAWDGEMLFNKVAMRPGSPTTVGVRKGKFLFALSGNPGACFVGFELFVRPVIQGMQGKSGALPTFTATLTEDFNKPSPFERFVRGVRSIKDGQVFVKPAGVEKSSITLTIKDTDCLIIIPPGGRGKRAGERVEVISIQ
ncbi:molybdopterin molybdenumtransferase [Polycladomyces abyssicola]|uniref:Molybdopterin molybdenumtransferase n=1 Tax=Polycladomyces abyssicola TaxID=1125966 RepID=A0A8D5UD43_9BACL|nr:gephyrin-like molybdotransferase Glp [Polycladomyces abyssicola]BCU81191.1 molybdopterin molybdenumtransferase [Polycladomyces abyssicola]